MPQAISQAVYEVLTGEDDGRVCRDVPESACHEQPGNFIKHVGSLAATKTGDGLADPKLVLSWLLTALGAPAYQVGLLVPVREAGSLLPQLVISGWIRGRRQRKWVWSAGSFVQGLAVGGMAAAAVALESEAAGATMLVAASLIGAVALGLAAAAGSMVGEIDAAPALLPAILFVLMVAHQGVRIGRSTHVVDMADPETRAAYTALSNSIIGVVLLASSAFGALAQSRGASVVLVVFAGMCLVAAWTARGLEEVQ